MDSFRYRAVFRERKRARSTSTCVSDVRASASVRRREEHLDVITNRAEACEEAAVVALAAYASDEDEDEDEDGAGNEGSARVAASDQDVAEMEAYAKELEQLERAAAAEASRGNVEGGRAAADAAREAAAVEEAQQDADEQQAKVEELWEETREEHGEQLSRFEDLLRTRVERLRSSSAHGLANAEENVRGDSGDYRDNEEDDDDDDEEDDEDLWRARRSARPVKR